MTMHGRTPSSPAPDGEPRSDAPRRSTASLGARILVVQAVTLLLLWLLQTTFGAG